MQLVVVLASCASAIAPGRPSMSRRTLTFGAAAAASLLPPGRPPHHIAALAAADTLPPAALMLRVAEVTDYQEALLRRAASYTDEERNREGLDFGRPQMAMSTDILLKNTKLSSLPGCAEAALTLGGVKRIASVGEGALTSEELLLMAGQYAKARDELRIVFEALPAEEQATAKTITRRLRAQDDERKRQAEEEALKEALYR